MKRKLAFLCLFLCCWFFTSTAMGVTIQNIRLAPYQPEVVRLVVELSDKTDASVFRLSNPSRLVVDFKNTSFSKKAPGKIPPVNFIKQVRRGVPNAQTARLVLELPAETMEEKHFLLKPSKNNKWRFVMDLQKSTKTVKKTQKTTSKTNKTSAGNGIPKVAKTTKSTIKSMHQPPPSAPKRASAITAVQPKPGLTVLRKSKKIIVLDPGHGGKDPGAISKSGKYEKHITLAMAKETRELLEDAGYKVVLTRDTDKAIPLRRRYQIAHEVDGDLFISIHADSARNSSARGLSVYTISEKASDKEAAALAERENKADILLGLDLSDYNPDVSNILIDLAKIDTMNNSAAFAKLLVKEMKKETTLVPNAHRFAGFAVLKSANIPSVLLELGYLSNRREDKLLQKKSYRRELGRALVRAVNCYFNQQN